MNQATKIAIILSLTLAPVSIVAIYGIVVHMRKSSTNEPASAYQEIDWPMLRELDVESGQKPPRLAAIDGKPVKIPGFVVPLDDNTESASEFLLVPSPQACIHVPPPPPNQMILVRMTGKAPERSWGPVWIMGQIFISTHESQYGKISYMMTGDSAEPYRMSEEYGG